MTRHVLFLFAVVLWFALVREGTLRDRAELDLRTCNLELRFADSTARLGEHVEALATTEPICLGRP